MPIFQLATPSEITRGIAYAVTDVPNHEAGRILHRGHCPMAGQVQIGGVCGPYCTPDCGDPTPPVYVTATYHGLVLRTEQGIATVWNLFTKRPEDVALPDDNTYPAHAVVDASTDVQRLFTTWNTWRLLEEEGREAARKKAEAEKAARQKAHKEREERARAARAADLALQESERLRRIASRVVRGSKIRVVADFPDVVARNARIKPRNRTPSLVGMEGWCDAHGSFIEPYVFLRSQDGTITRVLRSMVRVVFPDGTLGEADVPWPKVQEGKGKVMRTA